MSTQPRPYDRFVILAMMRSGSNLLERFLMQYDGLACHGELFNPVFIGHRGQNDLFGIDLARRAENPAALMAAIDRALPDQINGLRYFPAHEPAAMSVLLDDVRCAKIILTRAPIESYVSLCIAQFTDIWLIGSEKDRLPMAVPISPNGFARYKAERDAYFNTIETAVSASGQVVYRLSYDDLADVSKVNALALALGARAPLGALHKPIKRQNPAPLHAKITNYAEVHDALGLPAPETLPNPAPLTQGESQTQWVWPRHYFVCDHRRLAFAPLLANTKQPITAWLAALPSEWRTGLKLDELREWRARSGDAKVITVLHQPLDRLYSAFMSKIFSTAPDAFQRIRSILERRYQLFLPRNAQSFAQSSYSLEDHRTAFHQFLVFIASNLRGETDIRQDSHWLPQARLVDIFAQIMPINQLIRFEQLDTDIPALEQAIDVPPVWAGLNRFEHAPPVYRLEQIYTAQTETLARAAYGEDYARFKFGNWRPGYAAFDFSAPISA